MPFHYFLAAAAISALLAIACERESGRHRAFYVLKPLTTLLLLGAALAAPEADPRYRALVVAGLAWSAIGDACLMFEGDRAFMGGLGSFLIAHLLFVVAFLSASPDWTPPLWSAVFALYGLVFFVWLLPRAGNLKIPVTIYGTALMAMAIFAAARWQVRADPSAVLALGGACLFVVSDSALAVRQFVRPYREAQSLILGTYWPAVGLIAASVSASLMPI